MCGIAGFVGKGTEDDLDRMIRALVHRGPDDEGRYCEREEAVFLGHRRLSVVDLSAGAQPLWNEDHTVAVITNGEIYNHRELRKELEGLGHRFTTDHCDTEVLVHGYETWGAQMVERLNGMWAFVIYDSRERRIFLSRDRFGKKPLYYTKQGEVFAFASELSALSLHRAVRSDLDWLSVKKYFAYGFIPAPRTLYAQVHKLPGGCNLTFDIRTREFHVDRYWEFVVEPFERIPKNPEKEWGETLLHLLSQAVQRRLEADVPLGVYLSGGIDSTAVSAMATRYRDPQDIRTFSIGFEESSFDESGHARFAAEFFGTDHHHKRLSLTDARQLVPDVLQRLDEPFVDGSIIPTYLLSRFTRSRVTVALSGDGGDELFAGYDPFKALGLAHFFDVLVPHFLRNPIRSLAELLPVSSRNMSMDFKVKRTLRGLTYDRPFWNPIWLSPLEPGEIDALFQERVDVEELYSEALDAWHGSASTNLVDRTLLFYTKLYLQDDILPKVDRASMMVSLEVRSPFLDKELVDFVRRIPSAWKMRKGRTKHILKEALRNLVPDRILQRPKKGFGIPLTQWLKDAWSEWSPGPFMGKEAAAFTNRMAQEHLSRKADHRLFLWAYIVLGIKQKTAKGEISSA
ncbi:MAG: asparagine synthase (glutamine-hydrolyzing) [Desulfobacteraceae bacterium]